LQNDSIDRIRTATFTVGRRGYDKREVDDYMTKLADWLEGGGADQAARDTVRRELERIGQKTGKILTSAEEAAHSIRADAADSSQARLEDARHQADSVRAAADKYSSQTRAETDDYAGKTRSGADAYSLQTRAEAETYSAKTRKEADQYAAGKRAEADQYDIDVRAEADHAAQQKIAAGEAKAKAVIDEGNKRRRDIEKVISDLERRRNAVVAALKKLSTDLAGTAGEHRPGDEEVLSAGAGKQAPTQKQPAAARSTDLG
jgi:DivIVA domain-containing protein